MDLDGTQLTLLSTRYPDGYICIDAGACTFTNMDTILILHFKRYTSHPEYPLNVS